MRLLTAAEIQPVVRIANYHAVLPGQSWPNRSLPDVQLILVVTGTFEYIQHGQSWSVQPGEVLLIEPMLNHTFRALDTNSAGTITGMHLELSEQGTWSAGDYRLAHKPELITQVADVSYLEGRFRQLATVFEGYLPYRQLLANAIAREIVLLLAGHWRQPITPPISPRMQEMLQFIRANLRQALSRHTLAEAFALSPEHVNHLFRRELGMPPSTVINRERVLLAYRMIHEQGSSVSEAAFAVGFSDPFYFSRVFKSILGFPPSQVQ